MNILKRNILIVMIFSLFVFMFISGCVQNPNDNLYYASCCDQNDTIYRCEPLRDSNGNYVKTIDGKVKLNGDCGACIFWNETSGFVYDSNNLVLIDPETN